jgi:hypothetical protein
MFTPKADGVRVLMVMCVYYIDGAWQRICGLLQRDGSCHLAQLTLPISYYESGGTLFDCELVTKKDNVACLLVFDCYSMSGRSTRALPLQRRTARISAFVGELVPAVNDSFLVTCKEYFPLNRTNLEVMQSFMENQHWLGFHTDGLILIPTSRCDVCSGRDESQFKMKPTHTIDLIVITDDDDETQESEETGTKYLASLDDSDDTYLIKQEVPDDWGDTGVGTVLECNVFISDAIVRFVPFLLRTDKNTPNSETTIARTLRTIRENVTVHDIV